MGQQWNESTAEIGPPTDTQGNIYQSALGPTELEGPVPSSQAIYYAKNIAPAAAGTNVVTIRFNGAAVYPDLRILEYSGIDPFDPVDAAGSGIGNGAASTSATVLTNNDADLLVGASVASTPSTGPEAALLSDCSVFQMEQLSRIGRSPRPVPTMPARR